MTQVHPLLITQLLMLLAIANGTPVIAKKIFWSRSCASS